MDEHTTPEKSLTRIEPDGYFHRGRKSRACILGLQNLETDDPELARKRDKLLEDHVNSRSNESIVYLCSIGGCSVRSTVSLKEGRKVEGECVAAEYCLKEKFEESGNEDLRREDRSDLYGKIMDTCLGYMGSNFCPKFDCNLAAGFSEDGIAGTAGECAVEIQPRLPLE